MGILNVTPDSFSDGGLFLDPDRAVDRAAQMADEGALFIDVGGASSRPAGAAYGAGAEPVPTEIELARVLPVVRALALQLPKTLISVDTFRADVAEAVLGEGAHLINDITALRHSPEIAGHVARAGAGLVLMHSQGFVGSMPAETAYKDVVAEVAASLVEAACRARAEGVQSILLDPGFGFGKSVEDNFRLVDGVDRLTAAGYPVLVGLSRKSSIGAALGSTAAPAPVTDRLYGSLGAAAVAALRGASIVRTHDVSQTSEMLRGLLAAAGRSIV